MEFQIESFQHFLDAHTRLNQFIKVSTTAIDFLSNSEKESKKLSELINKLILESGERWTPRILNDPKRELDSIKNDLTKSAIVWVYSAFDVFFKKTEGILSIHFPVSAEYKSASIEDSEDDKEHKIIELYKKLDWETTEIKDLLIVFRFYEAIRHSTAHNMGKPSGKLKQISNSQEFSDAITKWKTKFKKRAISAPPIVTDTEIELKPHHAIMYSETCRRIGEDINAKLFTKMGMEYFIEKTIKKHLTEVSQLNQPECLNFERYLAYHLKEDYKISISPYNKVYEFIDTKEKIETYKKRYISLKNNL